MSKIKMTLLNLCLILIIISSVSGLGRKFMTRNSHRVNSAISESVFKSDPLFLTPLIEAGKIEEARDKSRIVNLPALPKELSEMESYSGFITTNKKYNNNIFFWNIRALNGDKKAPLLIWLQGGPGASSLFGLFAEHGPFTVDENSKLVYNEFTWTQNYSLLYIDNPVGTGFSFTDSDDGYAKTEDDVAENLYEFLRQFYILFDEFQDTKLFVTGESYGGKYVPALASKILQEKSNPKSFPISLAGIAIGNGFSDPKNMLDYGVLLEMFGLIGQNGEALDVFAKDAAYGRSLIAKGDYEGAFEVFDQLMDGDLTPYPTYFHNATGFKYYLNYLQSTEPEYLSYFNNYLALPEVHDAIHVGNKRFNDGKLTEIHLRADIMKSVTDRVTMILNNGIPTMFYSGNLDIIVASVLTEQFLTNLAWEGQASFVKAPRKIYEFQNDIAGYVQSYKNLIYASVRGGGHLLPVDQPEVAKFMIDKFINVAINYPQALDNFVA